MITMDEPRTTAELQASCPTQGDLDTATRVVWWLYHHAMLYPDAWGEDLAWSPSTGDVLIAAANACGTSPDCLFPAD